MATSKTAADVTDTPEGLDVVITEPGTIVGSHDLQGTDGKPRTDRPGELLGSPLPADAAQAVGQAKEGQKQDHVVEAVDKANREELPLLGGTAEDTWEPTEAAPASKKA